MQCPPIEWISITRRCFYLMSARVQNQIRVTRTPEYIIPFLPLLLFQRPNIYDKKRVKNVFVSSCHNSFVGASFADIIPVSGSVTPYADTLALNFAAALSNNALFSS